MTNEAEEDVGQGLWHFMRRGLGASGRGERGLGLTSLTAYSRASYGLKLV